MQVTRRRRVRKEPYALLGHSTGRRATLATACITAVCVATGTAFAATNQFGTDQVGKVYENGQLVSADQYIAPYGDRLVINSGKIMASKASPDGTHLAASVADGDAALVIVDLKTNKVVQRVGTAKADELRIPNKSVGQAPPAYSPDGKQLWLGQLDGFTRFTVNADGTLSAPVAVPIAADGDKHALASGVVFSADGKTVYAAVNGQNRVVAIDAATGTVQRSWAVGNAPRELAQVGNKLYVGNEGGRTPEAGEDTLNSYGTQVPADPDTGAATSGTVSVIELEDLNAPVESIDVGLHPTALYGKNGVLFVADTGSDQVSVIDSKHDKVVQRISTKPWPEASVGYEPTGITLTDDGRLLVTLGRADAVAVYRFKGAQEPVSYVGLLPTDYFPAAVTTVGSRVLVSNTRGIDALRPNSTGAHNTHDTTSSLTWFTLPGDKDIRSQTEKVFRQNGWTNGSVKTAGWRQAKPVPVPERIGDPSTIKHVFLIVKENRTFDQLFGDLGKGNGDPKLAQFGEAVTPNQHALARQFGVYDNTYDIGTNSAEGHNWLMQADNPAYTESSAGEYERSYDTEDDALGHQRSGFLWTGVQATGQDVRDFGEFHQFLTKPDGANWQNLYCDSKTMDATGKPTAYPLNSSSPIPSLNSVSVPGFPKFDLDVPDVYRYQVWKQDFEQNGPAALNMLWLSSDHTGGPASPAASVADNDLATGKIVDEISHSEYWKDSAIFVVEDDSQAGLDHVDGHRAPIQVISPWAQHGTVDSRFYSQITMVRTIEQILGVKPMNQKDSAATPMATAFTGKPDFTPFNAVPNRTSLTDGLKTPPSCGVDVPATAAPAAAAPNNRAAPAPAPTTVAPPTAEQGLAAQWDQWKNDQHLTGPNAKPDRVNPAQMNHLTWYQTHNWTQPYPGESTILAPNDVPGAYIPSADHDG
ncbi:bifunctional YncE family protein/alkaline phosphatase family protein [Kitasatospora sp. NPDC101183]|uniref:bifunctional YncE family protein/alkaline phosphatase family protein n=1 Tax=Kitasatospora sp. NPDC101183 TaxID=3364100 RepID=UPI0038133927